MLSLCLIPSVTDRSTALTDALASGCDFLVVASELDILSANRFVAEFPNVIVPFASG